ncbi:hypothetical protein H6F87_16970 [Cyanobacteria bacterium FACHB-502]|nr:hypothetical protein [Cyanobacteria bacterium FACHB-502]
MKLSKIIFSMGLATLGLSSLLSWQQSNAIGSVQQYSLATASPAEAASSSRSAAAPSPPAAPVPTTPSTTPIAPTVPAVPASSPATTAQGKVQIITACNGRLGNANFRSAPSLLSEAVLGVVARGQSVRLTGRTVVSDGIVWHEAIVPEPLYPSTDPAAINQLRAGQTGYLVGCFVGG